MPAKTRLEYREEQEILDIILKPFFGNRLVKSEQEMSVWVSHPEWSPNGFEARIDNYYVVSRPDGSIIPICVDLHGSWHAKGKVQNWDSNKRLAMEWSGYTYIELRNYDLAEEVPALYDMVPLYKKLRVRSAVLYGEEQVAKWQAEFDGLMLQAKHQVMAQMALQSLLSLTRKIVPESTTNPS